MLLFYECVKQLISMRIEARSSYVDGDNGEEEDADGDEVGNGSGGMR